MWLIGLILALVTCAGASTVHVSGSVRNSGLPDVPFDWQAEVGYGGTYKLRELTIAPTATVQYERDKGNQYLDREATLQVSATRWRVRGEYADIEESNYYSTALSAEATTPPGVIVIGVGVSQSWAAPGFRDGAVCARMSGALRYEASNVGLYADQRVDWAPSTLRMYAKYGFDMSFGPVAVGPFALYRATGDHADWQAKVRVAYSF